MRSDRKLEYLVVVGRWPVLSDVIQEGLVDNKVKVTLHEIEFELMLDCQSRECCT